MILQLFQCQWLDPIFRSTSGSFDQAGESIIMIYNVASISLLSVSWKELISPLFVIFFRSYMSVAKTYFWGADLAQPASRPVHSRSSTHSSISIRRSQIVIKKFTLLREKYLFWYKIGPYIARDFHLCTKHGGWQLCFECSG